MDTLSGGKVASKLVTILPGRRIDQIRADLINDGYSPSEVDAALQPANYKNLPLMSLMPANLASLEGLLYPDSFQRTPNTPASDIITQSLNAMQEHLTISWQQAVGNQGLSPYQGIILASIVEQEVSKQSDRTQAAQVFSPVLKKGCRWALMLRPFMVRWQPGARHRSPMIPHTTRLFMEGYQWAQLVR